MSTQEQPNVLFIFSDQHRGMDMHCAGNDDVISPNMDRLADEGRQFSRTYANAPVCTPSRAVLLSGQYPLSNRVIANDLPFPTDVTSVAEVFRDGGYRTGYVGKWHLGGVPRDGFTPPGPHRQGFDDFWAAFNCTHNYYGSKYYRDDPEPIDIDGYEPETHTELAQEFLEQDDDRPFCLFLSYGPPHAPYKMVPDEYRELYDADEIDVRPNVDPIPPGSNPNTRGRDPRDTLADYYAQITAVDDQLGRLLDHLDESGLADDTIVVYTSDHGDMLWSQGMMKKEQPWEESVNVPFLVRWPGEGPAGTVHDGLLAAVDMAPTMLSLAGLDVPEVMEGRDRSTALRGGDDPGPESVLLSSITPADQAVSQDLPAWRGIRTERYTYARLPDGTGWVLYDNEEDPYQLRNRVLDREYDDVRERLDRLLDERLEETGDNFRPDKGHIEQLGLVEEWNARERELHPDDPDLL